MQKVPEINIPSTIQDDNYRYKMPKLILKIEGKGNGIKTNLVNLHDVAKALRCPDEYPLKFLAFELGSSAHYTFKNDNDVTCILNGAFQEDDVRKALDKFIEKYILCPQCRYPEMQIKVRKGKLGGSCECCGAKSDLDSTHRLATFIEKNPPKPFKSLKEGQGDNKAQAGSEGQIISGQKQKAKTYGAEELTLGGEYLNQALSTVRETYQRQATGEELDIDLIGYQFVGDIRSVNIKKGLHDRVCYLIFQGMFDATISQKQIQKNGKLLQTMFKNLDPPNPSVEILLNIEHLFDLYKIELKFVPNILKYFYDGEILTTDFLVSWGENKDWSNMEQLSTHFLWNKEKDAEFRAAAKPIIDWLKTEDEEEEEEGEEETA